LGAGGRAFKSPRPDHKIKYLFIFNNLEHNLVEPCWLPA